jgi:acetylornithine deacetylase/succinyl-diaminopimelate desuccinylase-like protein
MTEAPTGRWGRLAVATALLPLLAWPLAAQDPPPPAARETPAAVSEAPSARDAARAWRDAHGRRIVQEFLRFLALPNVASDSDAIRANAVYLLGALGARGVEAELLETPGSPPVVYAHLPAEDVSAVGPGRRTPRLVLYAHYDGQPVDPDRWTHDPWTPTLYSGSLEDGGWPQTLPDAGEPLDPDWRVYARSAGDDKAPIQALLSALDALEAAGVRRTVDVRLFFEGEEEAGSPHLEEVVEAHRELLQEADAWLFLDGPVHQTGRPQVFFGVRGYTGLELTVYGATRYLHSGHYGNWAPNPSLELARLLTSMKDEDGRVLVEGFYESSKEWPEAARAAAEAAPRFEDELRAELGLGASEGGDARYLARMMVPSLNVHGIQGATVGETARNVIPPEATAALDLRLVPGNDPHRMLRLVEDHIRAQGYHVVSDPPTPSERREHPRVARVVRHPGYPAVATALDSAVAEAVIAATRAAAPPDAGDVVVVPTLGGSLPWHAFRDALGAPPLIGVPIANHDDNQHAPDENLRLGNLWYGIDLFAELLTLGPLSEEPDEAADDGIADLWSLDLEPPAVTAAAEAVEEGDVEAEAAEAGEEPVVTGEPETRNLFGEEEEDEEPEPDGGPS